MRAYAALKCPTGVSMTTLATAEPPADHASTPPRALLHELLDTSFRSCYDAQLSSKAVGSELKGAQDTLQQFVRGLSDTGDDLQQQQQQRVEVPAGDGSNHAEEATEASTFMARGTVAPPRAYFAFRGNGRMHLPIIDWAAFRGYSVVFWLNVDLARAGSPVNMQSLSPTASASPQAAENANARRFTLYRFTNNSGTLGVEASLQIDPMDPTHAVLAVRSCSPNSSASLSSSDQKRQVVNAPAKGNVSDWKSVEHRVNVRTGQWHLLTITHSLHYVKKSKVSCYVDTSLQFQEELMYPSGLVSATKCVIGGGKGTCTKVASVTMYQEELSKDLIAMIHALGPVVSSFNRFVSAPIGRLKQQVLGDYYEISSLSPMGLPTGELFAILQRTQIVFCFTAYDLINEDYQGLGVEWISEGVIGNYSKWVTLEALSSSAPSSEIQQRNARLGKNVEKVMLPDSYSAWYRAVGVSGVPMLLHYILSGWERLAEEDRSDGIDIEAMFVDLITILGGMLMSSERNQDELLSHYVFHMLSHVLRSHQRVLVHLWSPRSMILVVQLIKKLHSLVPCVRQLPTMSANHPVQDSMWNRNPLFASGIRTLLLDFRLWSALDFKSQSIFIHQLYGLVCEFPQAFNDVNATERILDILRDYYSMDEVSGSNSSVNTGAKTSQDSTPGKTKERELHWKQQCITTLVEAIEVCLTNSSVCVHEVCEQELLETTFAAGGTDSNGAKAHASAAASSKSAFYVPRQQGGVFSVNLESIIWSDQQPSPPKDAQTSKEPPEPVAKSVLSHVQVRFSVIRNIRSILRFLIASKCTATSTALLQLLRRLAVSFLDMRFALLSSSLIDCLLYMMGDTTRGPSVENHKSVAKCAVASHHASIRMTCAPLFIYMVDWLESIEGRTIWCGLDEHLRMLLNGDGTFSSGFLELMLEFYFDPTWRMGVQQSVIMNDPSKKESVLFPISATAPTTKTLSINESGIIVEDGTATSTATDSGNGLLDFNTWIRTANQYVGKRLPLSWERRIAVIKMTGLRNLTIAGVQMLPLPTIPIPLLAAREETSIAELFDEGVSSILALPLRGILPFLPVLLRKSTSHFRERVLLDISVKLKTDEKLQAAVLQMRKDWAEALLELSLVCTYHDAEDAEQQASRSESPTRRSRSSRAFSVESAKTGEDLVFDTSLSLLCVAMQQNRGWRSISDLILALKSIRLKYAQYASKINPQLLDRVAHSEIYSATLNWMCRVVGVILHRMSKSRTILSRALAENVQKILFLTQETLLALPLQQPTGVAPKTSGCVWSDEQLQLLESVMDMSQRLVDSTHKVHRIGLVPALKILLHALAYVSEVPVVVRIVRILELAFQQELSPVASMRVYDHEPARDVFLSSLVLLRRALLVQENNEIAAMLHNLILRIGSSGLFTMELHSAGLSLPSLAELPPTRAVTDVLEALAIPINDKEMHEKEDEASAIPHFPVARELRNSHKRFRRSSEEDQANSVHSEEGLASTDTIPEHDFLDDQERLLWAALEVEENRMMETVRDLFQREKQREVTHTNVVLVEKEQWLQSVWRRQELAFRSQNEHYVLGRQPTGPVTGFNYRVGVYESPVPGRSRRMLDLDYVHVEPAPQVEKEQQNAHRLCEDVLNAQPTSSPLGSPAARASEFLLEQVGRVVAAQGGGEIRDITSDLKPLEEATDEPRPSFEEANGARTEESNDLVEENDLSQTQQADLAEEKPRAGEEITTANQDASIRSLNLANHYFEKGADPCEGLGIAFNDQVTARVAVRRVVPEGLVYGDLFFCNKHLVFQPKRSKSDSEQGEDDQKPTISASDEIAPGLHRCWRWRYRQIVGVYLRRYRLRDSAMEIFVRNGTNHFIDFPFSTKQQRNEFIRLLYSFLPRHVPKQWPGRNISVLSSTTKAWQNRQISNFEYLMALNTFAGRSFNDLTQYPVFPWILRNYDDDVLDLSDPHNFRDLSKPVGALNPERLEEFWERYHSFDDPVIPKFLYGSHYSTCAGVVLFFLFRLQPYANLHRKMQGGAFDLPDRLFNSIKETWNMCNSQMSEVKELTPEFFIDGSFLKNVNMFPLGKRHDQREVNDVMLPKWAKNSPEEFVRLHRAALESEYVSSHLHEWIDLIFGYKQRGKAALKANNVFYYLTYYGVVDLDRIDDPFLKESMELQIAHFGQCPMQLLGTPHPKRNSAAFMRKNTGTASSSTKFAGATAAPGVVGATSKGANANVTANVPRPLAVAFQDHSLAAQKKRQEWSPCVEIKPLIKCGIRLLKILPDRLFSVNELGVIEMYYWKLVPRPPSPRLSTSSADESVIPTPTIADGSLEWADGFTGDHDEEIPGWSKPSDTPTTSRNDDSERNSFVDVTAEDAEVKAACPWLLEVVRDDSPFDYVPRVPVFEVKDLGSETCFPVAVSSNGRLLISGGSRNGSIHLRLLDLDNGHVIAKASVCGHDDSVTCLSIDKFNYQCPTMSDDDDLLVSGSRDGTLALWRLSRVKPDLLFRLPRISTAPLLMLRGHRHPIIDCCVSTRLGVVVSCSEHVGLVHFIHQVDHVGFTFRPHVRGQPPTASTLRSSAHLSLVRISNKGFVIAISRITQRSRARSDDPEAIVETAVVHSMCQVYNLAGVLTQSHLLDGEEVSNVTLSTEGDLIILTLSCGKIRFHRLDDFVVVQEYLTPAHLSSPIAATCVGPNEAVILLASGHQDGSLVLHLLPDADGSVSFLTTMRRLLGVNAKLKMVKGTVQQAQSLAMSTIGNAKAVTNTARDIAGEALGEAKSMVKGFFSYLPSPSPAPPSGHGDASASSSANAMGRPTTGNDDETRRLLPPSDKRSSASASALESGAINSPPQKYKSVILSVCSFILVTEFCERLAYYGLTGSLPIFFHKHLGLDSVLATELNNAFTSLSYLTPLMGAFVADRHLGRFSTIVWFSLIYLAGLAMCVVAAVPAFSSAWLFNLGLFGFVAIGAGGIKPNVVVLGADQFNVDIPAQRAEKDSFFNWFYWAINIGATFSYGVLTNLAVNGIPGYVSADYGFFVSFLIPAVVFVVAFVVFYSGKPRYRRVPPKGSALSQFFAIVMQAGKSSAQGKLVVSGGLAFIPGIALTTISYFVNEPAAHMALALGGAGFVIYGTVVLICSGSSTQWLRLAIRENGGSFPASQVKDVSQVLRLSPYFSFIIIFWAVYGQQSSNFVLQGCQMDLRLNRASVDQPALISSAMLSILDSSVILIFIPIFDRLVYPAMSAIGIQPTLLRKVGAGLVFSFLSMLVAGWVEQYRKSSGMLEGLVSNCGSATESLPMSTISVWWQTPQYLLIGISEILTSISSYDLFYSEVPESMRSVCQALNLLTTTLGYIVAGAINSIFSFWITSDLNDGQLEYIFYVLALLVLANFVAFVYVSQSFEYHVPPPDDKHVTSGFSPALPRAARGLLAKLRPGRNRSQS
ncbi:TPA: hypothetical protein N0F65_009213 [Lagenidium giganteum]|uniref:Uncharacterized protein n=1 Tax=Lagenidium giganteum TaxID=4803 RepID=A0AAV2YNV2_9STRA|nr:TPA: hypothetical protein N0F65_009213 [Lagenidium giganteum]